MQNELLQVIEKNLPAEVGKTLNKRLQEAETDREALLAIKAHTAGIEKENVELRASNAKIP